MLKNALLVDGSHWLSGLCHKNREFDVDFLAAVSEIEQRIVGTLVEGHYFDDFAGWHRRKKFRYIVKTHSTCPFDFVMVRAVGSDRADRIAETLRVVARDVDQIILIADDPALGSTIRDISTDTRVWIITDDNTPSPNLMRVAHGVLKFDNAIWNKIRRNSTKAA